MHRRTVLLTVASLFPLTLAAGVSTATTAGATSASTAPSTAPTSDRLTRADRATLHRYATDTWRSNVASSTPPERSTHGTGVAASSSAHASVHRPSSVTAAS